MFGIKNRLTHYEDEVAEPVKEPVKVKAPEPHTPEIGMEDDLKSEYLRVSRAIGLDSSEITKVEVKAFLKDHNISIYDDHDVEDYLDSKMGEYQWCWKGIREVDRKHSTSKRCNHHRLSYDLYASTQYEKQIPLPVLLTIEKIQSAFPEVKCFVSDVKLESDEKDPFLMIVVSGRSFIVERWDEPSFRGKTV